ncbi:1-acyl-sn-glycerol-3-phosphate acyltransferase [Roseibium salinum]|nr:1-acyl-sn-glycerol-3-phosphate acyltransferase [Roseibium salinum]
MNRTKRAHTGRAADEVAERMAAGDAMVLFAEGTSNDGNSVLPFRSALLGAATRAAGNGGEGIKVWVQPLSLAYRGFLRRADGPGAPAARRLVRRYGACRAPLGHFSPTERSMLRCPGVSLCWSSAPRTARRLPAVWRDRFGQ